jgi:hypothetical protein
MRTIALLFAVLLFSGLVIPEAVAQEESWKKDRFLAVVGFYRPDFDTEIRVDDSVTGNSGTLLNLEKDLDLQDRESQIVIGAHFRFAKRHMIEFDYVELKRTDESSIGFTIDYDGNVLDVNEDVNTTFNTKVARLAYRFSFINNEKMELSAALGLHITDLTVGLNAIGEDPEFNEVTAPLPTIGLGWKYHFNENWTFNIRGDWLDIEIDNVEGQLTAGLVDVSWFPWRNFGFSLGYNIWDMSVSVTKSRLTGTVEYRYDGPLLALKGRF